MPTYSKANDFPDAAINVQKMADEIRASAINAGEVSVSSVDDVVTITFSGTLSAGDKTLLDGDTVNPAGGLIAAHDNTPSPPKGPAQVEQVVQIGGMKTDTDGLSISVGANAFADACYSIPENFHVQGSVICWTGFLAGDYGWLVAINPAGTGTLGAQADAGQPTVTVAAGKGAYYNPNAGASYLEIWTGAGEIKEVRKIASVNGDVVTLASNLSATYDATHEARVRVDGFSPVRGVAGIDGGFRLVGSGTQQIKNDSGVTELLPVGLALCMRIKTNGGAGIREIALNFIFRKPLI